MRALITGGARGLGEAIAERLVSDGADAVLMDISEDVERTAQRIATLRPGSVVKPVVADVTVESDCYRAVSDALNYLGGLDVLVNNAGIGGPTGDLVDNDPADFRRVVEVNLVGVFLVSRQVARVMIQQASGGAIVNIASIFGQRGEAGSAGYSASKGGLILLTQALAQELARHSIRVNAVAPGHITTQMHWDELRSRAMASGRSLQDQVEVIRASIPLGRHGTGADVASAVAWLVSRDAGYVTGQTLGVNGGIR
jgi:NAD(P)-dependent dehydrogenase (short-subunit alcohol dehydrogenase family)